jgi:hypothetical protein
MDNNKDFGSRSDGNKTFGGSNIKLYMSYSVKNKDLKWK